MKTRIPFAGRSLFLACIMAGLSCVIAVRLVDLQIIDQGEVINIAENDLIDKERIPAQRGIIMDRNE